MIVLIKKTTMNKSILSIFFLIASLNLLAQNVDDIRTMAGKNDWGKAKEAIDKYLSSEKNAKKGDGWFLKAQIYNGIARGDAGVQALYSGDPRTEAFTAYKKYLEIDPKGLEGTMNQHSPLFDIAFGYQEIATNAFNSKKFEDALSAFRNAETVEEYIVGKGFTYGSFAFAAFDTQLYLNIAAAAINAKKEDIAVSYYQRIADKKIKDKGFDEIYRYIVDYFDRKGDKPNTDKYLAVGGEVYPNDEYWCEVGLKALDNDKKKLFAKYDELIGSGGCDNYYTRYNYAVELYNYSYVGEKLPDDRAAMQKKLEEVLKKAIEMKPQGTEANMLMARHHLAIVNELGDNFDAIKGTKPEDVKKRNDINAQIGKKFDDVFPYINTLYTHYAAKTELKKGESGQFKIVTQMMMNYWESKKNKEKVKEFSDKLKAIE
jgi:hypothetical protein